MGKNSKPLSKFWQGPAWKLNTVKCSTMALHARFPQHLKPEALVGSGVFQGEIEHVFSTVADSCTWSSS